MISRNRRASAGIVRSLIIAAAGASMLVLSACSDDSAGQSQTQSSPDQPATGPAESAGRRLDEATRTIREEAAKVGEQARDAAQEAIKNAGPLLEKAGDAASRLGQSASEILDKAARDLNTAVEALNNDTVKVRPDGGDATAILAPADKLKADTRAAARAYPAGVGPAYVGVWAADAASCARIDQDPLEMFAVITPTTLRRYESVCNITGGETTGTSTAIAASCIAEGESEDRALTFTQDAPDKLSIATDGGAATPFVRCHLPKTSEVKAKSARSGGLTWTSPREV